MRVLVVEDEILIALDLTGMLENMGHQVVGPASTVRSAVAALENHPIDFAILDFNLRRETSEPVADALVDRRIAFFFLTSYRRDGLPRKFIMCPLVSKPITEMAFDEAIQKFGPRI